MKIGRPGRHSPHFKVSLGMGRLWKNMKLNIHQMVLDGNSHSSWGYLRTTYARNYHFTTHFLLNYIMKPRRRCLLLRKFATFENLPPSTPNSLLLFWNYEFGLVEQMKKMQNPFWLLLPCLKRYSFISFQRKFRISEWRN